MKKHYAKVKLLKEKTLATYRQQIYLQVDEAISSKKLSEQETILADHKDILEITKGPRDGKGLFKILIFVVSRY